MKITANNWKRENVQIIRFGILALYFTLFSITNGFGQIPDTTIYKVLDIYPEFRYATEENTANSLERYFRENFKMPRISGEYYNDKNSIVQLVINEDLTFSYYDWLSGSCWAQINKSGFWTISNDTLILISNGKCDDCFEFTFKNQGT